MTTQEFVLLILTFCSIQSKTLAENIDGEMAEKRAPGWGKRDTAPNRLGYLESVLSDLSRYELNRANEIPYSDINKRRPGWGKRTISDDLNIYKRKPGWGKRAYTYETDSIDADKRTPGWGKRSYDIARATSDDDRIKRRPGWGKRSAYDEFTAAAKRRPGWGKRSPGWGKRSEETNDCQSIINDIRNLRLKIAMVSEIFFKPKILVSLANEAARSD